MLRFAFALPLLLASCAGIPEADVAGCALSIAASGQMTAEGLLMAAAISPACEKLAVEGVQAAVRQAMLRAPQ
jgi:hypothetical protein